MGQGCFLNPIGRAGSPRISSLSLLFVFFIGSAGAFAAGSDPNGDGVLDGKDLYSVSTMWKSPSGTEAGFNQTELLKLVSLWQSKWADSSPYAEGRAVGIRAVVSAGGKEYTSNEIEIDISRDAAAGLHVRPQRVRTESLPAASLRLSENPPPRASLKAAPRPSAQEMFSHFNRCVGELKAYGQSHPQGTLLGVKFGEPTDKIGTFNGKTFWIGFSGSFSDTYAPKSETYAWVCYFAPEGAYLALQKAKAYYSQIDMFVALSSFFGVLWSPDQVVTTKKYINDMLGVSISFGLPVIEMEAGMTFSHLEGHQEFERSLQFDFSQSASLNLLPILGLPEIPITVSAEYESSVEAGFYPYIGWDLGDAPADNPVPAIVEQLEVLAVPSDEVEYPGLMAGQSAKMLLPVVRTLLPNSSAGSFGNTLDEFLGSSAPNTTLDDIRKETERWRNDGEKDYPPPELAQKIYRALPNPIQMLGQASTLRGGVNAAFEAGYKHGYDAAVRRGTREDDTIYVKRVRTIHAQAGKPCIIDVTSGEVADALPGTSASSFEGVNVIFKPVTPILANKVIPIKNGKASFTTTPDSNATLFFGVRIDKSAKTHNKNLELARICVIVDPDPPQEACVIPQSNVKPGGAATLTTTLVDGNGLPTGRPETIRLYDYQGKDLPHSVQLQDNAAVLSFVPKPSVPAITKIIASKLGYTEEDAHTGYIIKGEGFSLNCDILIDGVSVQNRTDWYWQVNDSHEIMVLPPDEASRLMKPSPFQIVNPNSIESEPKPFTP